MKKLALLLAVVALGLSLSAPAQASQPAQARATGWYFDGAIHPYGNPHWCFYGALSSTIAIVTGTPVVLEKCKSAKNKPEPGEYWHGARLHTVGQMFLLAKPNYVLGRHNRKEPVCFVPFEYVRGNDAWVGFMLDHKGYWHLEVTDQVNKKPYFLIAPEHLKASVTAYAMKWRESSLGVPKGWTDIVVLPTWKQPQLT